MSKPIEPFTFQDNPLLLLVPAGIFAFVGACFLVIGFDEAARGASLPALGAFAAGLGGFLAAYLAARHAEQISVTFDRSSRRVVMVGRLPWQRREETWHFDEVDTVEPEVWDDSDGTMWRPLLVLKSGQRIPLMANWRRDRELTLEACRRAREQLHS